MIVQCALKLHDKSILVDLERTREHCGTCSTGTYSIKTLEVQKEQSTLLVKQEEQKRKKECSKALEHESERHQMKQREIISIHTDMHSALAAWHFEQGLLRPSRSHFIFRWRQREHASTLRARLVGRSAWAAVANVMNMKMGNKGSPLRSV